MERSLGSTRLRSPWNSQVLCWGETEGEGRREGEGKREREREREREEEEEKIEEEESTRGGQFLLSPVTPQKWLGEQWRVVRVVQNLVSGYL